MQNTVPVPTEGSVLGSRAPDSSDHGSIAEGGVTALHAEQVKEAVYVHPEARSLFQKCPWIRYIPLFGEATEGYGPKATISLAFSYFLCKGTSDYLVRTDIQPLMRTYYHVDGKTFQRLNNVVNMGWSLKALTATISDLFPLFGYTKRWYMLGSCIIGPALSLGMAFLPAVPGSAAAAAGLAFICCFSKANVDILLEGHYSRLIRHLPGPGPALVSWIWWFILLGSLVSAVIVGPLADAHLQTVPLFIASGLQLISSVFFILNWHGENTNRMERLEDARFIEQEKAKIEQERLLAVGDAVEQGQVPSKKNYHPEEFSDEEGNTAPNDQAMAELDVGESSHVRDNELVPAGFTEPMRCCCGVLEFNKDVFLRQKRLTAYSVLMACGVITMAVLSIVGKTKQLLIGCVVVSTVLCSFNFYALPLIIAKANLYSFLQHTTALQFPGALVGFYLATPDCLPDGPGFSQSFYITVSSVLSNIAGVAGITLFNYIFSKRSYRMTFIVTTLFGCLAAFFDLILVERWNRPHVDDKALYILGDAVVQQVIYMMNWMPMIVLLSKLCPRGNESMVYAILAGFGNLGQSMASSIGSLVMEFQWPVTTEPPCDFSNLSKIVILKALVPLVQIPLCLLLIPSANMSEDLQLERNQLQREAHLQDKKDAKNKSMEGQTQQEDDLPPREPVDAEDERRS